MNALDPSGKGADAIAALWWVMFALSLIPVVIVVVALGRVVLHRRRGDEGDRPAPAVADEQSDRRIILLGGVALPVVLLLPVAAMMIATAQGRETSGEPALEIEVTARQYWWDLRYPTPGSVRLTDGETFRTANELHLPVDRPVDLVVHSTDVIHSLWVPELDGKIDTIPGRVNRLRVEATKPGVFEGRCAEFCGESHTNMRLVVVAHRQDDFEAWHEREAAPVAASFDARLRNDFTNKCGVCHDVRGMFEAESLISAAGPDLTHLAGRRYIGAGMLPNTREALARWIVDPEGAKPGNLMPDVALKDGAELAEIVDFLRELE